MNWIPIAIASAVVLAFIALYYIVNVRTTSTEGFATSKIVYIYSNSCSFCKTFTPIFENFTEYVRTNHPNIEVTTMEAYTIASDPALALKYTVDAYPTILVFDQSDKRVKQIVGKRDMNTLIKELL